jgi:hypothetical protein
VVAPLEPRPARIEAPFPPRATRAHLRQHELERRHADVLVSARGTEVGPEGEIEERHVGPHEAGDRPGAHDDEGQAREKARARKRHQQQAKIAPGERSVRHNARRKDLVCCGVVGHDEASSLPRRQASL